MTEAEFQTRVIDYAILLGWRVAHIRPARTAKGWRTPYIGHTGLPDLILVKHGRVLLAELKSETGKPTLDQQAWITAAGRNGYLWRPRDWSSVQNVLGGGPDDREATG